MELQKIETKGSRKFKKRKHKKPPATQERDAPESRDAPENRDADAQTSARSGWTDAAARRQLAVGVNEVTKALERDQLRLLLVCKSAKPKHMTDHLIALSVSRAVPACQVSRLSGIVSEPLRLKSVLALGFRRCRPAEEDRFAELVGDIIPRVPPLHVAWLPGRGATDELLERATGGAGDELMERATGGAGDELLERATGGAGDELMERATGGAGDELLERATGGAGDELMESDARGRKRKLDDERELNERDVTQTEASSCTLQPLQVKKVIPNPKKKRTKKI
ncbi:Ribonuclease P protein subunit p38 [Merluccius polli]|uniref:Ribonuclease P protein subunit p38 n=1 Tax=Merluccius polli TaxID=89951 RepID=A0AA47P506_MERPO|nr:Ribonuclease P protein subunit p38 [Merluccius polli]